MGAVIFPNLIDNCYTTDAFRVQKSAATRHEIRSANFKQSCYFKWGVWTTNKNIAGEYQCRFNGHIYPQL